MPVSRPFCPTCGAAVSEEMALEQTLCDACAARDTALAEAVSAASPEGNGPLGPALAEALRRVLPAEIFAVTGISAEKLGVRLAAAAVANLSVSAGWSAPEDDVFYRADRAFRRPPPASAGRAA